MILRVKSKARSDHDSRSSRLVEYLPFILNNFRDSPTVPGDWYLNYRVPGYAIEERQLLADNDKKWRVATIVDS